jgi:hypothetical protein
MQRIVDESNRYAEQYFTNLNVILSPHARTRNWTDMTMEDLKMVFGLLMLTGIIKKPEFHMFWSRDEMLATPFFNATMSRNKIQLLTKFLHFNDNEAMPADNVDKLYKIRPVLDALIPKFRAYYTPHPHISIDEGMLRWKGRLAFRVYNPMKPINHGIKSYILADSHTSYCWNLKIYDGTAQTLREIVLGLLGRLLGHFYSLYMDNFYNSVALSEALLDRDTYVVGTLRKNRGEPQVIREAGTRGHALPKVIAWQDNRCVKAISTKHDDAMREIQIRGGGRARVNKPVCIIDYNENMNGVDRIDQMLSYYPTVRKKIKWTKKLVLYMLELSLHNAHVIYNDKHPNDKMSLLNFQLEVIKSLCKKPDETSASSDDENPPQPPRAPIHDPPGRLTGGFKVHKRVQFPPGAGKMHKQKNCRVCRKRGKRQDSRYFCKDCKVTLCPGECFDVYHAQQRYY